MATTATTARAVTSGGTHPRDLDKRARILDGAVKVFAKRGFFHARVSDVAKASGVADGTIYLYFKSKDEILISIFEDRMEWILAELKKRMAKLKSAQAKLEEFIDFHIMLAASYPDVCDVITIELRQSNKFMKEYANTRFLEYQSLIGDILREGKDDGTFRGDIDPAVVKRAIFGALLELVSQWVLMKLPANRLLRAASQLKSFVLNGVGGKA